jgi:hypothetical protein
MPFVDGDNIYVLRYEDEEIENDHFIVNWWYSETHTMGLEGGSITLDDITLDIPANALSEEQNITIGKYIIFSNSCTNNSECSSFAVCDGGYCTETSCPNHMLGNGTENNACQITSCEDLYSISQDLSLSYELTNDIDMKAEDCYQTGTGWPILGSSSNRFEGTLDGNGYTISNLYQYYNIYYSDKRGIALFDYIGESGTIKNIKLTDVSIYGIDYVGTLASRNYGLIEDVSVTGAIIGYFGGGTHGGLVAQNYGTISKSHTNVNIKGNHNAGLAVYNYGDISNCYARGNMDYIGDNSGGIGGLVYKNEGTITNSYATGNIYVHIDHERYSGGLVGDNINKISNSFSTGTVKSTSLRGGLVGYNKYCSFGIKNSYFLNQGSPDFCDGTDYTYGCNSDCTSIDDESYFKNRYNEPLISWDFNTTWAIDSQINDGFPYLLEPFIVRSRLVNLDTTTYYSFDNELPIVEENDGKIEFKEPITSSGSNLNDIIIIKSSSMEVKSELDENFNKPAVLTFNVNIEEDLRADFKIYKDGLETSIIPLSYEPLSFEVDGFSTFSFSSSSSDECTQDSDCDPLNCNTATGFCCTDEDKDGYSPEGGSCGEIDCDDDPSDDISLDLTCLTDEDDLEELNEYLEEKTLEMAEELSELEGKLVEFEILLANYESNPSYVNWYDNYQKEKLEKEIRHVESIVASNYRNVHCFGDSNDNGIRDYASCSYCKNPAMADVCDNIDNDCKGHCRAFASIDCDLDSFSGEGGVHENCEGLIDGKGNPDEFCRMVDGSGKTVPGDYYEAMCVEGELYLSGCCFEDPMFDTFSWDCQDDGDSDITDGFSHYRSCPDDYGTDWAYGNIECGGDTYDVSCYKSTLPEWYRKPVFFGLFSTIVLGSADTFFCNIANVETGLFKYMWMAEEYGYTPDFGSVYYSGIETWQYSSVTGETVYYPEGVPDYSTVSYYPQTVISEDLSVDEIFEIFYDWSGTLSCPSWDNTHGAGNEPPIPVVVYESPYERPNPDTTTSSSIYMIRNIAEDYTLSGEAIEFLPHGLLFFENVTKDFKINGTIIPSDSEYRLVYRSDDSILSNCSYSVISTMDQTIYSDINNTITTSDVTYTIPAGAVLSPQVITIRKIELDCDDTASLTSTPPTTSIFTISYASKKIESSPYTIKIKSSKEAEGVYLIAKTSSREFTADMSFAIDQDEFYYEVTDKYGNLVEEGTLS